MDKLKNKSSENDCKIQKCTCCNQLKSVSKCKNCDYYDTWAESCRDKENPKSCGGPY